MPQKLMDREKKTQMTAELQDALNRLPCPIPIVLDANWVNGLGIIRSLAVENLGCLAISSSPNALGLHSRTAVGLVCPDPKKDAQAFISFMLELGKKLPARGVLLVTDDTYMLALAQARPQLEPYFIYSFPEYDQLSNMMDKWEQYRVADQECGVPIPHTIPIRKLSDLDHWPDSAFPAIIKGRLGKAFLYHHGRQVIEVQNRVELLKAFHQFKDDDLLLQEIIPGGDESLYTFGSYISPAGELLGAFTGRKLRQKPAKYGTCREGESLSASEVLEQGLRLLKCFRFYGVSQVEFKLDPRDHKYKLIEINGRFWMWHSLATHCGINLSAIAYYNLSGVKVEPKLRQVYGPRWGMSLYEIPRSLAGLMRGDGQIKSFLEYLRNPHVDAVLSYKDPGPILPFLVHYIH